jgi:hypothetical protein
VQNCGKKKKKKLIKSPAACATLRRKIRRLYGQFDRDAVSKYGRQYVHRTPYSTVYNQLNINSNLLDQNQNQNQNQNQI